MTFTDYLNEPDARSYAVRTSSEAERQHPRLKQGEAVRQKETVQGSDAQTGSMQAGFVPVLVNARWNLQAFELLRNKTPSVAPMSVTPPSMPFTTQAESQTSISSGSSEGTEADGVSEQEGATGALLAQLLEVPKPGPSQQVESALSKGYQQPSLAAVPTVQNPFSRGATQKPRFSDQAVAINRSTQAEAPSLEPVLAAAMPMQTDRSADTTPIPSFLELAGAPTSGIAAKEDIKGTGKRASIVPGPDVRRTLAQTPQNGIALSSGSETPEAVIDTPTGGLPGRTVATVVSQAGKSVSNEDRRSDEVLAKGSDSPQTSFANQLTTVALTASPSGEPSGRTAQVTTSAPGVPKGAEVTTAEAAYGILPGQLIQTLSKSEMKLHVNAEEFGKVAVHTTFERQSLSAQITLENAELGSALTAHLPAVHQRLGEEHGLKASVTVDVQAGDSSSREGRNEPDSQTRRQPSRTQTGSESSAGLSAIPHSFSDAVPNPSTNRRLDVHI